MQPLILGLLWIALTLVAVTAMVFLARLRGPIVLVGVYAGLVITSAIAATKIISLPGTALAVPAGVIVYSVSFLITDILAECYPNGRRLATTAVWTGFFLMLLYFAYAIVTVHWPAAPFWENQEQYETIINPSWRIALAGAGAFLVSQLLDISLFHFFKKRKPGRRWLWLRNNASTWVSQFVDTFVFISLAFVGVYPIWGLILAQYLVKIVIAALDTPFIYIAAKILDTSSDEAATNAPANTTA